MKRFLQQPWCLGLGAALLAVAFLGALDDPARGQGLPALPKIEKIKHEGYVETLIDKVTFKMVPIPGGTYMMGSPAGEKSRVADEGPQHPVTVKPFWMG